MKLDKTTQELQDEIEFSLPQMPLRLRELVLDAVWTVLCDNVEDEE